MKQSKALCDHGSDGADTQRYSCYCVSNDNIHVIFILYSDNEAIALLFPYFVYDVFGLCTTLVVL